MRNGECNQSRRCSQSTRILLPAAVAFDHRNTGTGLNTRARACPWTKNESPSCARIYEQPSEKQWRTVSFESLPANPEIDEAG